MNSWVFALLLWIAPWVSSIPLLEGSQNKTVTPLVIWHGLGDTYSSNGMDGLMNFISGIHPGIFIHSVFVKEDPDEDRNAGWFGDIEEQLPVVAEQLASIPELQGGFDAIGFSQGGQFLRAYNEKHNYPPVRNLITFGSQHMGIADTPACAGALDLLCHAAKLAAASKGIYSEWAQSHIIPAQYFRNPKQLPAYLSSNRFLTSINNEIPERRNETFAKNFASLNALVLVLFTQDQTVVPKESAWFGSYAPPADNTSLVSEPELISMKQQPLYLEDWIGLRTLDEAGRVKLLSCEGKHMQISTECLTPLVRQYVGSSVTGINTPALFVQY